jgi:hypothetical protein
VNLVPADWVVNSHILGLESDPVNHPRQGKSFAIRDVDVAVPMPCRYPHRIATTEEARWTDMSDNDWIFGLESFDYAK